MAIFFLSHIYYGILFSVCSNCSISLSSGHENLCSKKIIGFKGKTCLETEAKIVYLLGLDALQVENQKYLIKT